MNLLEPKLEAEFQNIKYDNLKEVKCGDIYLIENKPALKCLFCSETFQSLESFTHHLSVIHRLLANEDEDILIPKDEDIFIPKVIFTEEALTKSNSSDKDDDYSSDFNNDFNEDKQLETDSYNEETISSDNEFTKITKKKVKKKNINKRTSCDEWKCKICLFTCKKGHERVEHIKSKHPILKKSSVCDQCGKCFSSKYKLEVHFRSHSGERTFKCEFCGFMCSTSSQLTAHTNSHIGFRPFVCEICSKIYRSNHALKLHRETHSNNGQRLHECDLCSKKFSNSICLKIHKKRHENQPKYEFECSKCPKSFQTKRTLVVHEQIHIGNFKYNCDSCDKKFVLLKDKKSHNLVHLRVGTPFTCDKCENAYAYLSGLNKHKKKHHTGDSKPTSYECYKCKEVFKHKLQFEEHCRSHLKEDKKFACNLCERRFLTKYSLSCHNKRVHTT